MQQLVPDFPPLLCGHRIEGTGTTFQKALKGVASGKYGAGDLLWSDDENILEFTLVLEPEVARERCFETLFLAMVAFGDAAGAICPPEIAITYQWPSALLMNGAVIGDVQLSLSDNETNGIPDHMFLEVNAAIKPRTFEKDPGLKKNITTMWDEGCTGISRTQLLNAVSRHLVSWIHTWSQEGFRQVHDNWTGRLDEKHPFVDSLEKDDTVFIGMDEHGNALVERDGKKSAVHAKDVLVGRDTAASARRDERS